MSLYLTNAADRKSEIPKENMYTSSSMSGNSAVVFNKSTWFIIIKRTIITMLSSRFITADKLLLKTMIHRGMRIFLIRSPLPTIEPRLCDVISKKKFQITIPKSRYTGKWGMSDPIFKNFTKTIYRIKKSSSGRSSDHAYPSTEPW